jgi:hypothetical protein
MSIVYTYGVYVYHGIEYQATTTSMQHCHTTLGMGLI